MFNPKAKKGQKKLIKTYSSVYSNQIQLPGLCNIDSIDTVRPAKKKKRRKHSGNANADAKRDQRELRSRIK
jgi:hypothetical protein